MKTSIRKKIKKFMVEYSKYSHWHKAAVCMAAVVAVFTISALVLPAVTIGHDTYCGKVEHVHTKECYKEQLICGYGETSTPAHVHTDSCYIEESTLSCTLAETPGHTHTQECISSEERLICTDISPEHAHTAECYETVETYICGQEESAGHTHTDACYQTEKVLNCTAGETTTNHQHTEECYEKVLTCTKEEHTHSVQCYANPRADVETQAVWEQTMANVELSGDWSEDLITIAKTQLGYHESKANYMISEQNEVKGYSRYGAWYGDTHGDWSAMFVSFCLRYAQIPSEQFISEDDCGEWINWLANAGMYQSAGSYTPVAGDIVFIDYDENGAADHAGIVEAVNDKEIGTIEGDSEDSVCRRTYSLTDVKLIGYGVLPEEPKQETETAETESTANKETPETETANTKKKSAKRYAVSVPGVASADAANVEAAGEGTVQARGTEIVLQDSWISEVALESAPVNSENWTPVTNDSVLKVNDSLRFTLSYTVPGGQLTAENRTVVYNITDKITEVQATSGTVLTSAGQEVGDYSITADGKMVIVFYEEYAKNNQSGQPINGTIKFKSSVDKIEKDENGNVKLPFNDTLKVEVNVEDEGKETADLQVTKKTLNIDSSAGTVTYEVTIDSENGTFGEVTLNDVMNQLKLGEGTFTVKDKKGNAVSFTRPESGKEGFELILPKMGKGEKYTVTYTAKLKDELINGTVNAGNKVSVTSKDEGGKKLIDSAEVKTEFKKEALEKQGEKQSDGKVKWTIIVNKDRINIDGWTLSDVLNGQEFKGPVTISPAVKVGNEDKTEINLPFTFPKGSDQQYEITYITDSDRQPGESNVTNKAKLTRPDGKYTEVSINPWVGDQYNPLSKTADKLEEKGDTAIASWTVTINADKGYIKAPWIFKDYPDNGQWLTQEQIDAAKAALDNALKNISPKPNYEFKPVFMDGQTAKYKGYEVTFTNDLPKGSNITFSYKTTAPLGDGMSPLTLKNNVWINNVWAGDQIEYKPDKVTVEKFDTTQPGKPETSHDYQENGTISWGITVYVPEDYEGGLTVTENLPEGVILVDPLKIHVAEQWIRNDGLKFNGGSSASEIIWVGSDQTVSATMNNGTIDIHIPKAVVDYAKNKTTQIGNDHKPNTIHLEVKVKLKDDISWTGTGENDKEYVRLRNEVVVKKEDGTELGTGEQTQTINKEKNNKVIKKFSSEIKNNIIPYSITINPERADLLPESETLTLKDTVEMPKWCGINLSLVPGSVKVYYQNADGSKGAELSKEEYPYTYTAEEGTDPMRYKLSIQIPDSQALIVEYKYKASGEVGKENWHVWNTATLEELAKGDNTEDKTEVHIKITESGATADISGATLCKVDADNNGIVLQGAEFDLYKWDEAAKDYVPVQKGDTDVKLVTGADGLFNMELAYNTAYKLVETKAPTGYELDSTPYYFMIPDSNTTANPVCKPNDFTGKEVGAGSLIYYPNKKNSTEIKVRKVWLDSSNNNITAEKDSSKISFQLWKHSEVVGGTSGGNVTGGDATLSGEIKTQNSNVWKTISTGSHMAGTEVTFSLTDRYADKNPPEFSINGMTLTPTVSRAEETWEASWGTAYRPIIYTYTYTLTSGSNSLAGQVQEGSGGNVNDDWVLSELQFTEAVPTPDGSTENPYPDEPVGTYTLNIGNGWNTTISNLPLKRTYDDGTVVTYTYYVKEISTGNFTTEITGNNVSSGEIVITNKMDENPAHELPETGGIGTTPYTLAGIVLIAIAFLLYINKKIIIKK